MTRIQAKPSPFLERPLDQLTPRQAVERVLSMRVLSMLVSPTGSLVHHATECRITINQAQPRGQNGHLHCVSVKGEISHPGAKNAAKLGKTVSRYEITVVPDKATEGEGYDFAWGELLPPALLDIVRPQYRGEPLMKPFSEPPAYFETYSIHTVASARDILTDFAKLSGIVRFSTWKTAPGAADWDGPIEQGRGKEEGRASVSKRGSAPSARRKIRVLS